MLPPVAATGSSHSFEANQALEQAIQAMSVDAVHAAADAGANLNGLLPPHPTMVLSPGDDVAHPLTAVIFHYRVDHAPAYPPVDVSAAIAVLDALVERGASVDQAGAYLWKAAFATVHPTLVQWVLTHAPQYATHRDPQGHTPLHQLATLGGDADTRALVCLQMAVLVAAGTPVDAKNERGMTAWDMALNGLSAAGIEGLLSVGVPLQPQIGQRWPIETLAMSPKLDYFSPERACDAIEVLMTRLQEAWQIDEAIRDDLAGAVARAHAHLLRRLHGGDLDVKNSNVACSPRLMNEHAEQWQTARRLMEPLQLAHAMHASALAARDSIGTNPLVPLEAFPTRRRL